jgi:hypothetical protein
MWHILAMTCSLDAKKAAAGVTRRQSGLDGSKDRLGRTLRVACRAHVDQISAGGSVFSKVRAQGAPQRRNILSKLSTPDKYVILLEKT